MISGAGGSKTTQEGKQADSVYGEWVPVEKNGEENKDDDNVFSSNLPSEVSKRTIMYFSFYIPESAFYCYFISDLDSVSLFLGPG